MTNVELQILNEQSSDDLRHNIQIIINIVSNSCFHDLLIL